jgi:hypothetical protein
VGETSKPTNLDDALCFPQTRGVRFLHSPMKGVTDGIIAFVTVVTQFLHAGDMRQLARVSRVDRESTERIWSMGADLLGVTLDKQPGETIGQVLRGWALPHCFAYAWSIALTACEIYMTRCVSRSACSFWTSLGFWGSPPSVHFGERWDNCTFVAFCSYDGFESRVTLTEGRDRRSLDRGHFLQSVSMSMGRLSHLCTTGMSTLRGMDPLVCAKGLFHILVHYGETLEFVSVHVPSNIDSFIALWFQLGVASTLNLRTRDCDNALIPACNQFQKFSSRITLPQTRS